MALTCTGVFLSDDDKIDNFTSEEIKFQKDTDLTLILEKELSELMEEFQDIISEEFHDVISDTPGKLCLVEQMVDTEDTSPILFPPPYRLPHMLHEYIRKEIKALQKLGIITPSPSKSRGGQHQ